MAICHGKFRQIANKTKLFLLLMVLLTFMTIVFRYNKIKTVFNKRWEIFTKVGPLVSNHKNPYFYSENKIKITIG